MSKDIRFHIGNISAELHATPSRLEDRLSKFGTIKEGLSFHSKPLGDHYFAYITLTVNEAQVERLKKAFNGVVFMGKKLSLDIAKSSPYSASNFVKEEPLKKQIEKEEGIQRARQERIDESKAIQRLNSITGSIITPHYISSKQQALGYTVSCHTYGDISGNTRSSKPGKVLYGSKSYGAWTVPKLKQTNAQHYANLAGAGEIIKGRLRKTPRPKSHFLKRQQTLRILINGELKSIKSYKTKLWGLEKNKTVLDLTWRYANGEWRSGDDHIIERKRVKVLESSSCGIGGSEALTYGTKTSNNDDHDNEVEDDHMDEVDSDEETRREAERNKSILASLFQKDTFERPVKVDDNDNGIDKEDIVYDSKGRRKVIRHDLEMMEIVQEEGGDEEVEDTSAAQQLIEAYKNEAVRPQDEVYYDESDEGNELDISELTKTEAVNNEEQEFEVVKQVVDDDEEEKDIDVPRNITNKTDTLRNIFSTESNSGFKLALSEDDEDVDDDKQRIDEEQEKLLEEIKKKQRQEEEKMLFNSKLARYGLFWSHSDSPFLLTQSQLQKLGTTIKLPGETELDQQQQQQQYLGQDETEYEKWFWSQRGDLSRECKRQKRDAIRRRKGKSIA